LEKAIREDLMTGSIVCGVDESPSARGAARVARELSARLRLRLVFVRVVEDATTDEKIAAIAARLHDLADSATEVDCGAHWLVEVGHAADRLVAVAEQESAALIVVGSTGSRSSLLGSVSAEVSRRSPCPVVVVAPGADRSLINGDDLRKTGFRGGLFDDGQNGVAGGIRLGRDIRKGAVNDDRDARDFAGGIVRFSLGGAGKKKK
jgi:nucleotide-binding universal stress UspA family protein